MREEFFHTFFGERIVYPFLAQHNVPGHLFTHYSLNFRYFQNSLYAHSSKDTEIKSVISSF